jgi:hypothetical protein
MAALDNVSLTPAPLSMDSATGRVLCVIYNETKTPTVSQLVPTDANGTSVVTITDASGNIYPLHMTSDGKILADVLVET